MAAPFNSSPAEDAMPAGVQSEAAPQFYGCHISLTRIVILTIVSQGLYWFYWMYRTWAQYRDYTVATTAQSGATHYPVWHGLTQLAPVYGWFRYYAHIEGYKALLQGRGVPDSLNLGLLTAVVVANWIVGLVSAGMEYPEPWYIASINYNYDYVRLAGVVLGLVSVLVAILLLCWMQSNFNRYWAAVDSRLAQSARFGKGELLVIILGAFFWIDTIRRIGGIVGRIF